MTVQYRESGVDLNAAEEITRRLKERLGTGLFAGFLPVSELKRYDEPVLVASMDGVGTKVRLAAKLGQVEGLGNDLVHHCVNDIAVHGATPLLFLDYLAFHRLDPDLVEQIVGSVAGACQALGITLAGGETAEMPLVYPAGHFDMAGAIIGVAERRAIVDGSAIRTGDIVVGFPSSGLHTNGYSLVQRLLDDDEYRHHDPALGTTLGEALLAPHLCYLREIEELMATGRLHGLAHVTGGGIRGNLARIIPDGLQAIVALPESEWPPLFCYLVSRGISEEEMRDVFNLGIGLIAVCDPAILNQPMAGRFIGVIDRSDDDRRVVFRDRD